MLLRKQLETGRIAAVRQEGRDRIIHLDIDAIAGGGRITTRTLTLELIGKYSQSGPRYTSYPTAVEFHERFSAADYVRHLEAGNAAARDLSLYVHIPFCEHVCYYCGCNKIITRNHDQSDEYLDQLERDIARQAAHIDPSRRVIQLHLGGGTPTFLNHTQLRRLLAMLHEHFPHFAADDAGEYSIEIDPRTVSPDDLRFLREPVS